MKNKVIYQVSGLVLAVVVLHHASFAQKSEDHQDPFGVAFKFAAHNVDISGLNESLANANRNELNPLLLDVGLNLTQSVSENNNYLYASVNILLSTEQNSSPTNQTNLTIFGTEIGSNFSILSFKTLNVYAFAGVGFFSPHLTVSRLNQRLTFSQSLRNPQELERSINRYRTAGMLWSGNLGVSGDIQLGDRIKLGAYAAYRLSTSAPWKLGRFPNYTDSVDFSVSGFNYGFIIRVTN